MFVVASRGLQSFGIGCLFWGAVVALAAPTTDLEGAATGAVTQDEPGPAGRPRPPAAGLGLSGRALEAESSTGNRHLDLLLDRSERADKPAAAPAPQSAAAASAAVTALAALRAKAAEKPPHETGAVKPTLQPLHESGALGAPEPASGESVQRREWSGNPGGATSLGIGERNLSGSTDSARDRLDDDNLLRKLPREVAEFLRANRYWLLGGLGLLAAVGLVAKGFSRRV